MTGPSGGQIGYVRQGRRQLALNNKYDVRSKDLLVCRGCVVMSRSEAPALEKIVRAIPRRSPKQLLEVGFGLGVSAKLLQQVVKPLSHDIVEIDRGIHQDLIRFSRTRKGVRPILGDFWEFPVRRKYDLIFFDAFDYDCECETTAEEDDEYNADKSTRMIELLTDDGLVCCPELGPGRPEPMPGFRRVLYKKFTVSPFLLDDGTESDRAGIVCWQRA